jgi:glutathione S-transferase
MTSLTLVIGNKNYSSWSLRPWLAMKYFGIEFEEIRIFLTQADSDLKIRQYSPSGKVPVLLHDSLVIWESLAICEYLAEEFPTWHWWPPEKKARAIARSISSQMHAGFEMLRLHMPMNCCARLPGFGRNPGVQEDIDRITRIWKECRQQFGADGDFLCGDFSIADAMFAPVVLRFVTYAVPLDATCRTYADTILALPALQSWLNDAASEPDLLLN